MSSVVPDGWTGNKLHEICDGIFVGHVGSTAEHYTDSSGVKFIRTGDLKHGKIRVSNTKYITREFHQKLTKSQLNPGDILVSRVGDTGQAALVPKQIGEANCANIIIIKPSSGISSEFLLSNINSEDFFNQAASVSIGSAQSVLNTSVIKNLRTLIPPLPEQKKIASILISVDGVIENTQKQIDKLQDLKKATMNQLLTKGIGHTEFKDSELGRIPKSWEVAPIGDVTSFSQGIQVDVEQHHETEDDSKVRFVRISDYTKSDEPPRYIDSALALKGIVEKDDVVMIRYGEAGRVCRGIVGAIANNLFTIRPNPRLLKDYLYHYSASEEIRSKVEALSASSAMPAVSFSSLRTLKIKIPPVDEQDLIVSVISSLGRSIEMHSQKLSQTQSLKKSLMQDLLTGKVRVTVN
jgi:type I restriction enzyme S subunit